MAVARASLVIEAKALKRELDALALIIVGRKEAARRGLGRATGFGRWTGLAWWVARRGRWRVWAEVVVEGREP